LADARGRPPPRSPRNGRNTPPAAPTRRNSARNGPRATISPLAEPPCRITRHSGLFFRSVSPVPRRNRRPRPRARRPAFDSVLPRRNSTGGDDYGATAAFRSPRFKTVIAAYSPARTMVPRRRPARRLFSAPLRCLNAPPDFLHGGGRSRRPPPTPRAWRRCTALPWGSSSAAAGITPDFDRCSGRALHAAHTCPVPDARGPPPPGGPAPLALFPFRRSRADLRVLFLFFCGRIPASAVDLVKKPSRISSPPHNQPTKHVTRISPAEHEHGPCFQIPKYPSLHNNPRESQ